MQKTILLLEGKYSLNTRLVYYSTKTNAYYNTASLHPMRNCVNTKSKYGGVIGTLAREICEEIVRGPDRMCRLVGSGSCTSAFPKQEVAY